jgi:pilus assembly protein Flp/PilA
MRLIISVATILRHAPGRMVRDLRGATAIEYGLILAFVAMTMIVGLSVLADANTGIWNSVSTKVAAAR